MNRSIIYDQAQGRDYDVLNGWREGLYGLGQATLNLLGSASTVIGGFAATPTGPTSLTINVAAGEIFETTSVDATAYGSLAPDASQTMQIGHADAQALVLTTAGLSSGQSRWALVQATFTQVDDIPADDPNGGLLAYLDATNPAGPPWSGPDNTGVTQPTRRKAVATVSVIYGVVAATGTEVPPNPSANNVPLYLIDLAFGQTTVSAGQILVAGPSVGANVPNNYQQAPFLAGLLNSHHSGGAGQAPKIDLTKEVQGVLPMTNLPSLRIRLQANTDFNISPTGNDATGNGSTGAPWATMQHAADTIFNQYDFNSFDVGIQMADSTSYKQLATFPGRCVGQKTPIAIKGNASAPTNVGWNGQISAGTNAILSFQNFSIRNDGTLGAVNCITSGGYASVTINGGMSFGAIPSGGAHIYPNAGNINIASSYAVTGGGGQAHWQIFNGGSLTVNTGVVITLTGTPTFSIGFLYMSSCALWGLVQPNATFVGPAAGPKYNLSLCSVGTTNGSGGSIIPGSTAGSQTFGAELV